MFNVGVIAAKTLLNREVKGVIEEDAKGVEPKEVIKGAEYGKIFSEAFCCVLVYQFIQGLEEVRAVNDMMSCLMSEVFILKLRR